MAQITETNAQYYQGSQAFRAPQVVQTTFDTDLVFGDSDPLSENYQLNNFNNFWRTSSSRNIYCCSA